MSHFDQDGMCVSETTRMMGAVLGKGRRFPVSDRLRQDAVDFLEKVLDDVEVGNGTKMDAVGLMLKMEQLNQFDEHNPIDGENRVQQPAMVLLLPPNGSEVVDKEKT